MSLNYTTIRLWWDGRVGQAQCDGVSRKLTGPPEIDPMKSIYEIDYAPELKTFEIRERACDSRRDLAPREQEAVLRWLMSFAASVKRSVRG